MGALLKLAGLQRTPSQALITAPSLDLIKSDNEFLLPEHKEIEPELEPEKLADYVQAVKNLKICEQAIEREKLLHLLKSKDLKVYDQILVNNFMQRYINHAFKTLNLGPDLWWHWIDLKEYRHPLPLRITNKIKTFYPYDDFGHSQNNILFFVSDIVLVTSRDGNQKNTDFWIHQWKIIPMKRKTEICFLKVADNDKALPEEHLIIDAWRGPTFSDEEAKI